MLGSPNLSFMRDAEFIIPAISGPQLQCLLKTGAAHDPNQNIFYPSHLSNAVSILTFHRTVSFSSYSCIRSLTKSLHFKFLLLSILTEALPMKDMSFLPSLLSQGSVSSHWWSGCTTACTTKTILWPMHFKHECKC